MPRGVVLIEQGGRGGVADYTGALSQALAEDGTPVDLVTATDHLYSGLGTVVVHPTFPYLRATSRRNVLLRRLKVSKPHNAIGYLLALPRIARLARRRGLVHLQSGEYAPLDLVMALILGVLRIPLVFTPHNTFERGSDRFAAWARGELMRRAVLVIVHAEADLAALEPRVREKAVVLPHGEYTFLARSGREVSRAEARASLGVPADAPATLLFGQLRPDKGLDDLLTAALEVDGLHVLVAGEDYGALGAVEAQLADPRLAGRVHVREGFASMDEAALMFAATDTVTLAYRQASQSGVLALAFGFARPPVVYPVGGLPEVVSHGETGWVCTAPTPGALAAALRDAAAQGWPECERRGAAGARYAADELSWPSIARRTAARYAAIG